MNFPKMPSEVFSSTPWRRSGSWGVFCSTPWRQSGSSGFFFFFCLVILARSGWYNSDHLAGSTQADVSRAPTSDGGGGEPALHCTAAVGAYDGTSQLRGRDRQVDLAQVVRSVPQPAPPFQGAGVSRVAAHRIVVELGASERRMSGGNCASQVKSERGGCELHRSMGVTTGFGEVERWRGGREGEGDNRVTARLRARLETIAACGGVGYVRQLHGGRMVRKLVAGGRRCRAGGWATT